MRGTESTGRCHRPDFLSKPSVQQAILASMILIKPDCGHQCHILVEKVDIVWGGAY